MRQDEGNTGTTRAKRTCVAHADTRDTVEARPNETSKRPFKQALSLD